MTCTPRHTRSGLCPDCGYDVLPVGIPPGQDRATLKAVGDGIMERVPNLVRVRVGAEVFQRLHDDLRACEYEYDFTDENGQPQKGRMCFRWSKPGLSTPNFLVYAKPVELDASLAAEAMAFDGREAM